MPIIETKPTKPNLKKKKLHFKHGAELWVKRKHKKSPLKLLTAAPGCTSISKTMFEMALYENRAQTLTQYKVIKWPNMLLNTGWSM